MRKNRLLKVFLLVFVMVLLNNVPIFASDGWQQEQDGQWIYMQADKKAVSQWVLWPDGTRRFLDGSGQIMTNCWLNFEGKRYFLRENGEPYVDSWFSFDSVPNHPLARISTTWFYAGEDGGILMDGWHELGGNTYYFYTSGSSPRNTFFKIDDNRYYADKTGIIMKNGWFFLSLTNSAGNIINNYYYANPDGTIITDGWYNIDGNEYFFDINGNSPRKNWVNIGDERYYVDENGIKQNSGWFVIKTMSSAGKEVENWYYAVPSGVLVRNGWWDMDGKRYYFDPNGYSYRKRWYVDGEKKRYYLDENGILMQDGWFKISVTNPNTGVVSEYWYYATEDGSVLKDGYHEIDSKLYYFDINGTLLKERWITTPKNDRQYLGKDGALYQNCWFNLSGTYSDGTDYIYWYHADEKGNIQKDGWFTIDGKEYYLNAGGNMATGWFDDRKYYLGEDGAKRYGWQWLEIEDSWIEDSENVAEHVDKFGEYAYFYFSDMSGKKRYCTSGTYTDIRVDGVIYGFDNYGILQRGWIKAKGTNPAIKGYRYYYPDDDSDIFKQGQAVTKAWLKIIGPDALDNSYREEWYYFLPSGEPACAPANKYVIKEIDGKRYAFDMYGAARYGLIEIDGEFYYFGQEDGDRSGVNGKCTIEEELTGKEEKYCFNGVGKGITGIQDGYFYYKGKLQKAAKGTKYEVFDVPGKGKRLISESGKMVKGKTVKDSDGCKWKVGSSGVITVFGSDYVAEIEAPEPVEYD